MNFRNVFITICTWPRFAVADHCLYIEQMALCRGAFPASRLPWDQLFICIDVISFARCNIFGGALLTAPVCPRRRFAFGAGLPTSPLAPLCLRRLFAAFNTALFEYGADFN